MHSAGMLTGAELKKARELLKESQEAFGARFGVDQSTIHRWESVGSPKRGAARRSIERLLSDLRQEVEN